MVLTQNGCEGQQKYLRYKFLHLKKYRIKFYLEMFYAQKQNNLKEIIFRNNDENE